MFKNIYKAGEYQLKERPYKIRGVFLSKRDLLEKELAEKKKEEQPEEKLSRIQDELAAVEMALAGKRAEVQQQQDLYNELLVKADEDIRELKQAAEEEALRLKEEKQKQGYDEGFEKGYYDGLEKGKNETEAKFSSLVESLQGITTSALGEKQKIISGAENDIVNLSVEIAKRVVKRELETDKKLILNLVKEGIKRLEDKGKIVIYAHPSDIETIKSHRADFAELVDTAESLHILPDELLEPGECKLESKSEIVDTDLNYQFGEIRKKLSRGE